MKSKGFFKDNQESMIVMAIMFMFTGGENGTHVMTLACWLAIWVSVIKLLYIKKLEQNEKDKK